MANELDPIVDQWYAHRRRRETFRVIDVDSDAGLVEMQGFDGNVEQVDMDEWREMDIELAAEPEDWTGPFDDIEPDDLGYTEDSEVGKDH